MADIDMDIDISRPLGSGGLADDDDLIDYEDDYSQENVASTKSATAQHEDASSETIADVIHVKPATHLSPEGSSVGFRASESVEVEDLEGPGGDEEGQHDLTYDQDNGELETGTLDQSNITVEIQDANGTLHDDYQSTQHTAHDENNDHDLGNEQPNHSPPLGVSDVETYDNHEHEDYDKDETYSHGIELETPELGGSESVPGNEDDGGEEHILIDENIDELDIHGDLMDQDQTHDFPNQPHEQPGEEISDTGRGGSHDLDDEITWEEEGGANVAEVPAETDKSTQKFTAEKEHTPSGDHTQQSPTSHEDLESAVNDTEAVETEYSNKEIDMDQNQLAADDEVTEDEESKFPAVTVQYKGEEFPLFSIASEGFFAEISILDETIEGLLGSFRTELSDELGEEDDLVFQVDELGLEYAESHPHDLLCSCTLRQILDIFDMLVKNQDPEGTRTLYTYLFTKPNPPRRWEALLESAASGHGLEEVMHIFNPRIPTSTEPEAWDGSEEHELLDDYESVEDGQGESIYKDTEEQTREEIDTTEDNHTVEEGDDLNSTAGSIPRQNDEEADHVNNNKDGPEESPSPNNHDQSDPGHPENKSSAGIASTPYIENDSNITTNPDIEVDGQDEEVDFGLDDDAPAASQPIVDDETGEEPSGSTATTTTLKIDEPDLEHHITLEDQTFQNESASEKDDQYQVDLAEIDWNEAEDNEITTTGAESTITSAKRSYPNDPQDLDENSDVKRRRS